MLVFEPGQLIVNVKQIWISQNVKMNHLEDKFLQSDSIVLLVNIEEKLIEQGELAGPLHSLTISSFSKNSFFRFKILHQNQIWTTGLWRNSKQIEEIWCQQII